MPTAGSSPLARGLLSDIRPDEQFLRIIPARAGSTILLDVGYVRLKDHPRSRGVYLPMRVADLAQAGSSPLARGLPRYLMEEPARRRIIPARAGSTECGSDSREMPWDHPRSRGVYQMGTQSFPAIVGSSPLARGLPETLGQRDLVVGIIPARAGSTCASCSRGRPPSDHPRSRGVYNILLKVLYSLLGSSPLARGLREGWEPRFHSGGIIPARAGSTS